MGNPEYDKVMRGVRGDNPDHKRRERAEEKRRKLVAKGEKAAAKQRQKHRGRHRGDDVIDTGMFD